MSSNRRSLPSPQNTNVGSALRLNVAPGSSARHPAVGLNVATGLPAVAGRQPGILTMRAVLYLARNETQRCG